MREQGIDPALERAADLLLKEDAKTKKFIRANGRGFTKYAKASGILTKKQGEKIRQTEIQGLDMGAPFRTPGERHSRKESDEE